MANVTKLYAAYKAGYLGNNILDTYFSFIANMISEEHLTIVEDTVIAERFKKRYSIDLPLSFVRQTLGVGVQKNCFVEDHGKYSVVIEELAKYRFSETDFNVLWSRLVEGFVTHCQNTDTDISSLNANEFILSVLDGTDEKILSGEKSETDKGMLPEEYAWYSFVKEQGESGTNLYSFISALSACNITKQALFFAGKTSADYSGLHIYLDSPIIFALLGMDESSRTDSYKTLVKDMQEAKCSIHVLDHNFQEVDGIIARASGWATDTQYDLRKANNAARFFHDSQMNQEQITEFCENIETRLNELGITVKTTNYDIYQDKFQEDEKCLFDMVNERYLDRGYELTKEKENSIRIDIRSIIMIYRERQGQTATRLQNAKHIMLTSNNAIANVSKKYESNRSTQSGHIPACISADLFGAILWLDSPMQMLEYHKQKLLADCYAFLKPDKTLLDKYIQSLDEARNADAIDEKKFLFLRTHKVVLDSLMDITKGDYARFNSNTYLEVYEDITAKSQKQYHDEIAAHNATKEKLQNMEKNSAMEKKETDKIIKELLSRITVMEENEAKRQEHVLDIKVSIFGWLATLILIGIPYLIVVVIIEIIKTQYTTISWSSIYGIIACIIATAIAGCLFAFGRKWCLKKVRHFLTR
ncbi:MAG: hypothetical protein E7331_12775 [Clostridiales bacterium]|nr:hypothetical protein [Clostridiales bacterium]